MDLRGLCSFTDYFVICSAETERQIEAIKEEIDKELREGVKLLHLEGDGASGWVLMDFGDVIIHIFSPSQREYYQLEKIWAKAPIIQVQ